MKKVSSGVLLLVEYIIFSFFLSGVIFVTQFNTSSLISISIAIIISFGLLMGSIRMFASITGFVILNIIISLPLGAFYYFYGVVVIHDASPFPFMAMNNIILLIINIAILFLYKLIIKVLPKYSYVIFIIPLLAVAWFLKSYYGIAIENNKFQALDNNREEQRIFVYGKDVYYASSKNNGVFKMDFQGKNGIFINGSIVVRDKPDVPLWLDGVNLHYRDGENWYRKDLKTEIIIAEKYEAAYADYLMAQSGLIRSLLPEESVSNVFEIHVNGDGYLYYSSDNGILRFKIGQKKPEKVIADASTIFEITGTKITYYSLKQGKVVEEIIKPSSKEGTSNVSTGFAIYLANGENKSNFLTFGSVEADGKYLDGKINDLKDLNLWASPIITDNDIELYDWKNQRLTLKFDYIKRRNLDESDKKMILESHTCRFAHYLIH